MFPLQDGNEYTGVSGGILPIMNRDVTTVFRSLCAVACLLALAEATARAASHSMETSQFQDRAALQQTFENLASSGTAVQEIGVSPSGEWIIIHGSQVTRSPGFPQAPRQRITDLVGSGKVIDVIAFSPTGSWLVISGDEYWLTGAVPHADELRTKIAERQKAGKRINEVQFTSDNKGWVLLSGDYAWTKGSSQ